MLVALCGAAVTSCFAEKGDGCVCVQHGIPASSIAPPVHRPNVPSGMHYEAEIEINDFPQHARWKVSGNLEDRKLAASCGMALDALAEPSALFWARTAEALC